MFGQLNENKIDFPSNLTAEFMTTIQSDEKEMLAILKEAITKVYEELIKHRFDVSNRIPIYSNMYGNKYIVACHLQELLRARGLKTVPHTNVCTGFDILWERPETKLSSNPFGELSTAKNLQTTSIFSFDSSILNRPVLPTFSFGLHNPKKRMLDDDVNQDITSKTIKIDDK